MPRIDSAVLNNRQLNRALLARQMLLARENAPVVATIERLVGMQAQLPRPPFMGLWTRLQGFRREQLLEPIRKRKVVRATAMRGTLHLLSTKDYLAFRPVLAEMLAKGADTIVKKRMGGVDVDQLYEMGREFFSATPGPFGDFRKHLERKFPKLDVRALAYTVRMGVPLAMVSSDVTWGWDRDADFEFAEQWLGEKLETRATALESMVLRYLAAFGPASPADFQTWSYLRGVKATFEKLRPRLVTFTDERKRELFDLPKAPRPEEDIPAPVRFLPEFDNALLAHDDRNRIVADAHRKFVFLKNLQIVGTVLVDGFVAGTWRVERKKKAGVLAITSFGALAKRSGAEVQREAAALLEFLEPDADQRSVTFAKQP